jgi:crotonobetainyl-CoA:carnitine CoA-transferase CaiB-like acyl-CoA transferase
MEMSAQDKALDGLSVVDFGLGLPMALVARMLADLGTTIRRVEPAGGDPFYESYAAYELWRRGAAITKAASLDAAVNANADALALADLCLIGGEAFPDLDWKTDIEALARRYPKLVILEITGGCHGQPDAVIPAVDLLMQAHTGLVHEQYSQRPMVYALPAPSYGAALQGLIGALAALIERKRSGQGQIARSSLFEGTLSWMSHFWFDREHGDWSIDYFIPKDTRQLIFRCADGKYIHFSLVTANAREIVFEILGIEGAEEDKGAARFSGQAQDPENFFGNTALMQSYVINWQRDDLLVKLWERGLSAEPVNRPGDAWTDEQVVHNGTIWREADGARRVGLPFTLNTLQGASPAKAETEDGTPLNGLRVVDFGTFAAGPHASMLMTDLGADVIKVESIAGDPVHGIYRPYSTSNRGKRHLALDLKKPEGLEIAHRLAARADAVHYNFRPGITKRLGIGKEALLGLNPSLIILENSGYGFSGPKFMRAGIDFPLQGLLGHEMHAGGKSGDLVCYQMTTIDFAAGMVGTIATLAAALRKLRVGGGATIESSLLESGLFLLSELIQSPDGRFAELPELNREQTGFHPAEQLYKAQDGWVAIAARNAAMSLRLLDVLGLEAKITAPRKDWGEAEAAQIAAAVAGRESTELLATLGAAEVWAVRSRANAMQKILHDPALQKRGTILSTPHPKYGQVQQIGRQYSLSRSRTSPRGDTPASGGHSREILHELGYDDAAIDKFITDGVVAEA